jgi:DNA-binding response OmpR family regulator
MPKVLIVEDDPAVRDVVEYALTREGMETEAAASGEAATELLYSDARFDLMILDVMLPDTDGLTLCRELRSADSALRDVPVIMVTARDDETSVVVGLPPGTGVPSGAHHGAPLAR